MPTWRKELFSCQEFLVCLLVSIFHQLTFPDEDLMLYNSPLRRSLPAEVQSDASPRHQVPQPLPLYGPGEQIANLSIISRDKEQPEGMCTVRPPTRLLKLVLIVRWSYL